MNFLGFILAQCLRALSQAEILFFIACVLSLIVAPIVVGAVGMAFERIFLRYLYGRRDGGAYLLLTFGLAVVLSELIRIIWGAQPLSAGIPDFLRGEQQI